MSDDVSQRRSQRRELIGVAAILGLATALVLHGLTRSPITWVDEVFYAAPARELANGAGLSIPIFGHVLRLDDGFYLQPPSYFVAMAGVFSIVGFSQTTARLGSAIPYLVAIVIAWRLSRRLAVDLELSHSAIAAAGVISAVIFAFNRTSLEMARSGRSDYLALCLLIGGVALAMRDRSRPAGAFVASVGAFTHPVVAFPAVALLIAALRNASPGNAYKLLLGPLLVTGAATAWVLSNPGLVRSQFIGHVLGAAGSHGLREAVLVRVENFVLLARYEPFLVLLLVTGVVIAAMKRRDSEPMAALLGILIATVVIGETYWKYAIALAIPIAVPNLLGMRVRFRPALARLVVGLLIATTANGVAFALLRAYEIRARYEQRSPAAITNHYSDVVPEGARVVGIPEVYFAAVSNGNPLRYWRPLFGLRYEVTESHRRVFRASITRFDPSWMVLPSGVRPTSEFAFLDRRFHQVSELRLDVGSGLNRAGAQTVELVFWRLDPR